MSDDRVLGLSGSQWTALGVIVAVIVGVITFSAWRHPVSSPNTTGADTQATPKENKPDEVKIGVQRQVRSESSNPNASNSKEYQLPPVNQTHVNIKSSGTISTKHNLIQNDNNDVLIHNDVVQKITTYDSNQPVYIAYGEPPQCGGPQGNNWMVPTSIDVEKYKIYREGDYWRAKNMVGLEFNIVQLVNNKSGIDNCKWAQLHFIKSEHIISHQDCTGNPRTAIILRNNSKKINHTQDQSPVPIFCACKAEQTFCFLSEIECQSNLSDRGCVQKYSSNTAFNINDKTKWHSYGSGWVNVNNCVIKERRSQ
jgi:hypothetical protein